MTDDIAADSAPTLGREVVNYIDALIRQTNSVPPRDPKGVLTMARHGLRSLVASHVLRPESKPVTVIPGPCQNCGAAPALTDLVFARELEDVARDAMRSDA